MTNDHKDKPQNNATLSGRLEYWRVERPSEWMMDEFIRDARKLEAQLSEARQQSEAEAIAYSALSAEHERLKAQLSEAQARLAEIEAQRPVEYQFQDRNGKWFFFMSDKHRDDTIESGEWPIRALYAAPVAPAAQAVDVADICNAYESGVGHRGRRTASINPYAVGTHEHEAYAIGAAGEPAAQAMCGCGDTFGEGSVCANCLCGKYVEAGHAVADDVVQYTLTEIERDALLRFNETCDDGEGYDVPKAMMRRLATVGVVQWVGGSSYGITEIGREIVDAILAAQQQKVKP